MSTFHDTLPVPVTAFSYILLMKEKHKDVADNFKINRKGKSGE